MKISKCLYCEVKIRCKSYFTMEHIVPASKGGNNSHLNKKPCCRHCNSWRGNMDLEAWKQLLLLRIHTGAVQGGRKYPDWQIKRIVTNITAWQQYVSGSGSTLMKEELKVIPVAQHTPPPICGHMREFINGSVFCYVCRQRGLFNDHMNCNDTLTSL